MIIEQQIAQAVATLRNGGVVVFPTETAYGLAADATNPQAVARICAIKGREPGKSFPLIAQSREMVERFAGIPRVLERLAAQHWPGPLTLVLPVMGNRLVPEVCRNETIAIRVSSHPVAATLSQGIDAPIVSTSANLSGERTCYTVEDVKKQFEGREGPDYYLDIGELKPEPPSTIVDIDDYGYPEVLRQGTITLNS
ncbi:threonylcarbamoyl-AMP synthase [Patescibacteria group bacterium]|nr:MAG: threonylcarbamoyl-AMP synthase [Patescibacteria group bacterium]